MGLEDIKEIKATLEEEAANACLESKKWGLLEVKVPQSYQCADSHKEIFMPTYEIVYVLGRFK